MLRLLPTFPGEARRKASARARLDASVLPYGGLLGRRAGLPGRPGGAFDSGTRAGGYSRPSGLGVAPLPADLPRPRNFARWLRLALAARTGSRILAGGRSRVIASLRAGGGPPLDSVVGRSRGSARLCGGDQPIAGSGLGSGSARLRVRGLLLGAALRGSASRRQRPPNGTLRVAGLGGRERWACPCGAALGSWALPDGLRWFASGYRTLASTAAFGRACVGSGLDCCRLACGRAVCTGADLDRIAAGGHNGEECCGLGSRLPAFVDPSLEE